MLRPVLIVWPITLQNLDILNFLLKIMASPGITEPTAYLGSRDAIEGVRGSDARLEPHGLVFYHSQEQNVPE